MDFCCCYLLNTMEVYCIVGKRQQNTLTEVMGMLKAPATELQWESNLFFMEKLVQKITIQMIWLVKNNYKLNFKFNSKLSRPIYWSQGSKGKQETGIKGSIWISTFFKNEVGHTNAPTHPHFKFYTMKVLI